MCMCMCVQLVRDYIYFSRLIAFDSLSGGNLGFLVHSENQQENLINLITFFFCLKIIIITMNVG